MPVTKSESDASVRAYCKSCDVRRQTIAVVRDELRALIEAIFDALETGGAKRPEVSVIEAVLPKESAKMQDDMPNLIASCEDVYAERFEKAPDAPPDTGGDI